MPGLCALVTPPLSSAAPQFDRMLDRLAPFDWFRTFRDVRPDKGVALGAVVLDTSRTTAPARSADGRLVLFLDGEIYDADLERRRLESAGTAVTVAGPPVAG